MSLRFCKLLIAHVALAFISALLLSGCAQPMEKSAAASLPTVPADLTELSAVDAAALIRSGELRSEDLTRALIAKAKAGSSLNAFITLDEKGALAAAQAADATVKAGKATGALHGVPLAIKDNIHVAGLPNTAGAPPLKNFVPAANAPVAQKLLDAGAIVLGKNSLSASPTITADSARWAIRTTRRVFPAAPAAAAGRRSRRAWRRRD
jgi:indoleacetamide hydrolase